MCKQISDNYVGNIYNYGGGWKLAFFGLMLGRQPTKVFICLAITPVLVNIFARNSQEMFMGPNYLDKHSVKI